MSQEFNYATGDNVPTVNPNLRMEQPSVAYITGNGARAEAALAPTLSLVDALSVPTGTVASVRATAAIADSAGAALPSSSVAIVYDGAPLPTQDLSSLGSGVGPDTGILPEGAMGETRGDFTRLGAGR